MQKDEEGSGMSIKITAHTHTTDANNNTGSAGEFNQSSARPVSAADRAARRAKRAQRLALQTESDSPSSESTNASTRISTDTSVVTLNGSKTGTSGSPFVIKLSNVTSNEKETDEKSNSIKERVPVSEVSNLNVNSESVETRRPGSARNGVATNVISRALNNNMASDAAKKPEVKTAPGAGSVRGRIGTWSAGSGTTPKYGAAAGASKFSFGTDYNAAKKTNGVNRPASQFVGRQAAPNKYTPTLNKQRPYSTAFASSTNKVCGRSSEPGRFQGIQKEEPAAPAIGGSAADRMAHFREAMEKEKAQKAKEEERKKQAEEKKKQAEEKRKEDDEKRKKEELEKKEEDEKKALEAAKSGVEEEDTVPDSEKIKHIPACQKRKEKKPARRTMSISNIVLDWVQEMTKDYPVEIKNFSSSWNNGMAFCALIHRFNPDAFDFNELSPENKRHNFDLAFKTGQSAKDIPILLDTDDMVRMARPEPRSVQCYIQWIWSVYGPTSGYGPTPQEVQNATVA